MHTKESMDALYYGDPVVQNNIRIRSTVKPRKISHEEEELSVKRIWLLGRRIPKADIEKAY